ncbi:adenosine deaminase [Deinococcus yavapaiensis]|uniref:adenosine deaminase n=1 Tax=Deinococcus yavapaiensis KR-236 TaxID=694435 RepID=A0A318SFN0_9DEIO|nr:adenosine deaminase [Deinococcus yavapaiensis]PYE52824.1 adenosine deaminase [Deinococcus yavapaiensis KR-236]
MNDETPASLAALPKVELHLHLDCSLSFETVHLLDPTVTRAEFESQFVAPAKCTNLADFLRCAPRSVELLQTARALRLAVNDVFEQLRRDRVVYAELRFAPFLHAQGDLTARDAVQIVNDAVEQAVARTGVEANVILCSLRHFDAETSFETARLVREWRGTRVVALDLAGDEAGFPLTAHVAAYDFAVREELHRTAHAGEAVGPQSVWETLRHLRPSRIGHGVRSIEDDALIEHLKREDIHLELCPSCNVQIGVFPTLAEHPVDRLRRAGVALSVNTDTRTLSNVTLTQEYERLARTFGWTASDFLACNLMAVDASFASSEVKARVRTCLLPHGAS